MKYDFSTLPNRRGKGACKWEAMKDAKPDVSETTVPLSIADMEFLNPPEISEGLRSFVKETVLGYTQPTDAYFQAVIDWMKRRKQWTVRREEMVCSPGVIPALYAAVRAFTDPGDGVLIQTPAYPPFYHAVRGNGRRVISSPLICEGNEYRINWEDLDRKTQPEDVKLLFLCNPHNPTGRSWREDELRQLGEICLKNHLIVVADEIHSDLMMPGFRHIVFAGLSQELSAITLTCTAPSKTFNLAGMQTSNIVISDPEKRRIFRSELERSLGGSLLNILGYEACRIAYTECEAWLEELIEVIWDNYRLLKDTLRAEMPEAQVFPLEGTYLGWIDLNAYPMTVEEREELHIRKAELFLDEGKIFGPEGDGFVRINLACPRSVLEQSLRRLIDAYRPFLK